MSFNIKTYNAIAEEGIAALTGKKCNVSADMARPEGILLRSADLHGMEFNPELLCIARAGAGYNNIPVDQCTDRGIVVFNAPGANANGVKEYEICALVLASRDVLGAIDYVKSISDRGSEIPTLVEKGKNAFIGPELLGRTIGVIGLGATGALIANAALDLGMNVLGYDPFMSVQAAMNLSKDVVYTESLDEVYSKSDYISLNVPYTDSTRHMINADAFAKMKDGVRIVNESRAEVVDDYAMIEALKSGKVAKYMTDFPNEVIINAPNVVATPHLGAVTPESEERCAVMAANEIYDYLKNGNIRNSINFPNVSLERMGTCRLCVLHRNMPGMINKFLDLITAKNINIEHMINKPKGEYAYTIIDLNDDVYTATAAKIANMDNVLRVRVI